MITLKTVSKSLNSFKLDTISFELPTGYIMGVIGENGAGKTTLINIISGLYSIDQGIIYLYDMNYQTNEEDIKQDIGVVVHEELFEHNVSLLRNATHYGRFYKNYEEALLLNYANRFCLDLKKKYKRLSKGEKLKFALAFALSHKPKLLLLDEPNANFDGEFRKEFQNILREYTSTGKNCVILSTHITSDVDKYADYVLMLKKGTQVLFGDIESVRDSYRMVAGEIYKLNLLRDRIIYIEEGEYGSRALVKNSHKPFDPTLKTWEPSVEELMYFMEKGGQQGETGLHGI